MRAGTNWADWSAITKKWLQVILRLKSFRVGQEEGELRCWPRQIGKGEGFDSQDLGRNAWMTRAGHDCILSQRTIWSIIMTGTTWLTNGCHCTTFTTPDADILRGWWEDVFRYSRVMKQIDLNNWTDLSDQVPKQPDYSATSGTLGQGKRAEIPVGYRLDSSMNTEFIIYWTLLKGEKKEWIYKIYTVYKIQQNQ